MHSHAILLIDANELRASGFATLFMPWACHSQVDLSVVSDIGGIGDLSAYDAAVCIHCLGGASLTDPETGHRLADMRDALQGGPLMVLSDLSGRDEVVAAGKLGLHGFLSTTMESHVALAAIQFVLAGGTYLPLSPPLPRHADGAAPAGPAHPARQTVMRPAAAPSAAATSVAAIPQPQAVEGIKPRHLEVLDGLRRGQTNKAIARELDLTEATIKLYVRQLMKIFAAENRTQLALKAAAQPQLRRPPCADGLARPAGNGAALPLSDR